MAQNEKSDIAFCGCEIGQVGRLRGQWLVITIKSGGLKPSSIADETEGACLSSRHDAVLGDPRSRLSSVCKRARAIGIQAHNHDRRVRVEICAIHQPRLGVCVAVNRRGEARTQFKMILCVPRNEVTFIVALENIAPRPKDL